MLGEPQKEQSRIDRIRAREARKAAMLKAIMDTAQGREWMYALLGDCHCFSTSFSKSALEMSFAEGERNVGLKLTAQIVNLAPDDYVRMLRENGEQNERKQRDRVDTDDSGDSTDDGRSDADTADRG